jgi:LytS/YehU family sensor histidine kinase
MLTAARMEIELLKKNIQPHFLLNTLATIMEVIEQDPRVAVTLIEALAGEFRILAGVSDKKLIPLAQELELCRAHLRIMTLRKGAACSMETAGADGRAQVPPALFHTLVENGLTHLRPVGGEQRFLLKADHFGHTTQYTLDAFGEALPAPRTSGEGTGLRYIKARLEESFAGRWKMQDGPIPGGWRTIIQVFSSELDERAPVLVTKGLPA